MTSTFPSPSAAGAIPRALRTQLFSSRARMAGMLVASVFARGIQFYAIAWLIKHQGGRIDALVRRYGTQLGWATIAAVVAFIGWWLATR